MRRRHCRRMPRRARLLRKHLSEFTSWSQLLKKSGFPRFRRKWQVYKAIIELSTSNKTGKPEATVHNRRLHSQSRPVHPGPRAVLLPDRSTTIEAPKSSAAIAAFVPAPPQK